MTAAMVGLVLSAVLSTILLPPRPRSHKKWKFLIMVVQWIIFPVCMVVFGSIPATDAQTRLMLGKYLGFNVTEKIRK
jgi:ACR3 family arsenite efflux pump ArsB